MFQQGMSVGEKLINGLGVTVIGMGVVFLVLIILSFVLQIFKLIFINKKSIIYNKEIQSNHSIQNKYDQENKKRLIAIISAAIAFSLNIPIKDIYFNKIELIKTQENFWVQSGRNDLMR